MKNKFIILNLFLFSLNSCSEQPTKLDSDSELNSLSNKIIYYIDSSRGVNLREKPSTNSRSIVLIPDGQPLFLISKTSLEQTINGRKGKWINVSYKEKFGYVFDGYLKDTSNRIFFNPAKNLYIEEVSLENCPKNMNYDYGCSNLIVFNNLGIEIYKIALLNLSEPRWLNNNEIEAFIAEGDGGGFNTNFYLIDVKKFNVSKIYSTSGNFDDLEKGILDVYSCILEKCLIIRYNSKKNIVVLHKLDKDKNAGDILATLIPKSSKNNNLESLEKLLEIDYRQSAKINNGILYFKFENEPIGIKIF